MTQTIETVATVLERELTPTIARWMKRVEQLPTLTSVPLTYQERTGHLTRLLKDLIIRLRLGKGEKAPTTTSAHDHGKVRFEQGYSVPMLIEESRLLQVSIFDTLRLNQASLDAQVMLLDVMTIADECDIQLQHTMETFMELEKPGIPALV